MLCEVVGNLSDLLGWRFHLQYDTKHCRLLLYPKVVFICFNFSFYFIIMLNQSAEGIDGSVTGFIEHWLHVQRRISKHIPSMPRGAKAAVAAASNSGLGRDPLLSVSWSHSHWETHSIARLCSKIYCRLHATRYMHTLDLRNSIFKARFLRQNAVRCREECSQLRTHEVRYQFSSFMVVLQALLIQLIRFSGCSAAPDFIVMLHRIHSWLGRQEVILRPVDTIVAYSADHARNKSTSVYVWQLYLWHDFNLPDSWRIGMQILQVTTWAIIILFIIESYAVVQHKLKYCYKPTILRRPSWLYWFVLSIFRWV